MCCSTTCSKSVVDLCNQSLLLGLLIEIKSSAHVSLDQVKTRKIINWSALHIWVSLDGGKCDEKLLKIQNLVTFHVKSLEYDVFMTLATANVG